LPPPSPHAPQAGPSFLTIPTAKHRPMLVRVRCVQIYPDSCRLLPPDCYFERRRSAQHQTARFDFVRRRLRFVAGRPPARQTVLNAGRGLAYAARPRGILELGYIPARLSLNNFGRFVCDPQGNLSNPTSAIDGVSKPVPCNLALDGEEVL